MLQRMHELAVTYASGSQSADSKAVLSVEFDELLDEISRMSQTAKFDGEPVFPGISVDF